MAIYRFHTTRHSAVRASERALSFQDLKDAVTYAERQIPSGIGAHKGQIFKFYKRVDGRTLVAVAEVRNGECWIITGYYED